MEIININDLKELTELGKAEFEKSVLEGPMFKNIVRSIEDAALEGYTEWSRNIESDESLRELEVVQSALIAAGYECVIKVDRGTVFNFVPYVTRKFIVDWK